jgi:predicted AAA+ superfamily ATPase
LENFVALELIKQVGWSQRHARLFHFRQTTGRKVDLVLEDACGDVVGIEVKASATVSDKDFQGLRALAGTAGERFRRGIVLYNGIASAAFGPNLHALPLQTLWAV